MLVSQTSFREETNGGVAKCLLFSSAGTFFYNKGELEGYNNNNGNFICVFECTIVNLATYRQFTNAA